MTEQDMVERVATRLSEDDACSYDGVLLPWSDVLEETRDHYRSLARAAIEAMREPSKEMIKAGRAEILSDSLVEDAADVWRAMNDKALGR